MGLQTDYLTAFSEMAVRFKAEAEKMARGAYAQTAPEDTLEIIGRDRNSIRFPAEDELEKYRLRVINAFEENRGRGNLNDIIQLVEGHQDQAGSAFVFFGSPGGFTSGFPAGTAENKFNIILKGIGGRIYDGDTSGDVYDGDTSGDKYDQVGINHLKIEIKRPGAAIDSTIRTEIITALFTIVRASIKIITITEIT